MTTFVFVHGGWHGGWCWREVESLLIDAGHRVFCPTMTGLGERSHLVKHVEGPDTHVDDIANVLLWNELEDVVLVGHSYGGMIVAGVATRMPERIQHLVFLDGFVPTRDNQAASDMAIPSRALEIAKMAEGRDTVPPVGFERWASSPDKLAWLKRMTTPHPKNCFNTGVSRVDDPSDGNFERTFILCGQHNPSPFLQFYEKYNQDSRWHCLVMDCLHDAMVEKPDELTRYLMDMA